MNKGSPESPLQYKPVLKCSKLVCGYYGVPSESETSGEGSGSSSSSSSSASVADQARVGNAKEKDTSEAELENVQVAQNVQIQSGRDTAGGSGAPSTIAV